MNIIGQIDTSAFAAAQRLHHREDEPALEFPSSASSRRRCLLALRAQNWGAAKKSGPTARDYVQDGLLSLYDAKENAGWGVHDDHSMVDIVGGLNMSLTGSGVFFGDDYVRFSGSGMLVGSDYYTSSSFVEIVADFTNHTDACFANYCLDRFKFGRYGANRVLTQSSNTGYGGVSFGGRMSFSFGRDSTYPRCLNGAAWSTDSGDYWGASTARGPSAIGGTMRTGGVVAYSSGDFCCMRVYNRALTASEIAANYAVDKARFGI